MPGWTQERTNSIFSLVLYRNYKCRYCGRRVAISLYEDELCHWCRPRSSMLFYKLLSKKQPLVEEVRKIERELIDGYRN